MANPNYKNILDDTGMEMVNALYRIYAGLAGTEADELQINYYDNNFNLLDSTGKKIVEVLLEIGNAVREGASGGVIAPATEKSAGLMSAEDKVKLDAFLAAAEYLTRDQAALLASLVPIVESSAALPDDARAGQLVLTEDTQELYIFTGQTWLNLGSSGGPGIGADEMDKLIQDVLSEMGA